MNSIALSKIKRWPTLKRYLVNRYVRIWSAEWNMYWRPDGCGYTPNVNDAGVYEFDDALNRTFHAGPEKQINYQVVDAEFSI